MLFSLNLFFYKYILAEIEGEYEYVKGAGTNTNVITSTCTRIQCTS